MDALVVLVMGENLNVLTIFSTFYELIFVKLALPLHDSPNACVRSHRFIESHRISDRFSKAASVLHGHTGRKANPIVDIKL
jgi:hypothetical protein